MKAALLALGMALSAGPAVASSLQWVSAPIFVGQTQKPNAGLALTWYPAIFSTTADDAGYYEVFVQYKPYYQEAFADHKALKARAACNLTGDNTCVMGKPNWKEVLISNPMFQN